MKLRNSSLALLVPVIFACGEAGDPGAEAAAQPESPIATEANEHGAERELGSLTLAGRSFRVVQFGELEPGKETAFEVVPVEMEDSVNAYLWLESEDGAQLCTSTKGSPEGERMHFHLLPKEEGQPAYRVVLRVRADGVDERGGLPLDGHGHEHVEGPHSGVPAALAGAGGTQYHLELKLHDDKGDLELWLAQDAQYGSPLDLAIDATIEVEFVDVGGRKVTMRPRNHVDNEDESGEGNMRGGKTNYFIFPSADGEDASWLQGLEFQSIVIVSIQDGDQHFTSEEFVLKPHSH
ncbi:MAG: hypothetical protein ACJAQ3_000141 [Planctomycetota bacterium]|jgi:hypothetical protein